MSAIDVAGIVEDVLRKDIEPPSEDYSAHDHGALIARTIDERSVSPLILESLRVLPASLAESFLDGLMDHVKIPALRETLLSSLPRLREVTSAALVVRWIIHRTSMPRLAVVRQLLAGIQTSRYSNDQNVYAYGLYVAVGEGAPELETSVSSNEDEEIRRLASQMPTGELNDYTRDILEKIMKK